MLPGLKLFDLTGRVAIITGGSKGLGLAMAQGLASAGAGVVLVSRHEDEAKQAADEVARAYCRKAVGLRRTSASRPRSKRWSAACSRTRADRHPHQQRRHQHSRADRRAHAGAIPRGAA